MGWAGLQTAWPLGSASLGDACSSLVCNQGEMFSLSKAPGKTRCRCPSLWGPHRAQVGAAGLRTSPAPLLLLPHPAPAPARPGSPSRLCTCTRFHTLMLTLTLTLTEDQGCPGRKADTMSSAATLQDRGHHCRFSSLFFRGCPTSLVLPHFAGPARAWTVHTVALQLGRTGRNRCCCCLRSGKQTQTTTLQAQNLLRPHHWGRRASLRASSLC